MPRVELTEQDEYEFHYATLLEPRDINHAGHLGNDALVSLVGEARAHMFRSIGLGELNLGDDRTGIIMSDLTVNFKAEGFMFDEIRIDTHVGEFSRSSFRVFHRVTRGEAIIAFAETGLVAFDYKTGRTVPLPETLLTALGRER